MSATPGPWRIYAEFNVMGGADGRRSVANAGGTVDGRLPDGGEGENRDNARLIAAAPAMLAELRRCVVDFTEKANRFGSLGLIDDADDLRISRRRVEDAIKRATAP